MSEINYDYVSLFINDLANDFDFLNIRKYAKENKVPIMKVETKEFLKTLLKIKKPKSILEIGTAIGYSSLIFEKVTKADITTIELSKKMAEIAASNFKKHKVNINLINKDAKEALNDINQGFDFVFIDANKAHYKYYFDKSINLLNNGGIIVCDNIFFRGEVINDDLVDKRMITIVKRLRSFLSYISDIEGFHTSLIPIGDGISISIKE